MVDAPVIKGVRQRRITETGICKVGSGLVSEWRSDKKDCAERYWLLPDYVDWSKS